MATILEQVVLHIVGHTVLQRIKGLGIADVAELVHLCLGKVLVGIANVDGRIDELDV